MRTILKSFALLAYLLIATHAAAQNIRYVNAQAVGGDGRSWDSAYANLFDVLDTRETEQGVALFSLEQSRVTDEETQFTSEQTEQAIAASISKVSEKTGLAIEVIHSDNIPPEVKPQIPADKSPKGFTVGDKVYLVHNHLNDAKDAQITFAHEVKGHFGANKVIGDGWGGVIEQYEALKKTWRQTIPVHP